MLRKSIVVHGRRVGWVDAGMALLFSTLGVWSMVIGVRDPVENAPMAAVPLVLLITLPMLFWRADPILSAGLWTGGILIHAAGANDAIRCGITIPIAFVLAVAAGAKLERRPSLIALGLVLGGLAAVGFTEPPTGAPLEVFPFVGLVVVALWGVGRLLHGRARVIAQLAARREEIRRTRERRAALEVADERMRIAGELDAVLSQRLGGLAAMAEEATTAQGAAADAALTDIERESRRTLDEMRTVVGALRDDADGAVRA